ncbi:hypothetical protein [Pseudarthrobacter sp. NamB4]|uniref:hypothetical protein n=1 Tax=Pseudarthrobacter sp. NamB4 TaxID=2576837 RepID=UPI0010FF4488|nr:hypothetical protein [Pseudarthrobacter sp. NamB4]TLM73723.1 hypothetical protein FDW81_07275 [Pseudarthrobacter sp. NamB4]
MNRSPHPSRTKRILATAALAAGLVGVTGALAAGQTQPGGDARQASSIEAVAERLAADQARERAEHNVHLTKAAGAAHDHMAHVLQGLASAVPVEGPVSPRPASIGDVEEWNQDLALAVSVLEAVEEGASEQAVTREAFIGAAHLLQSAAGGYGQLLNAPAAERELLAATVAERRDAAVRLWQAGAAQLDSLTVGSGGGHVHLFLAPDGDPDAVPQEFQEPDSHK